MRKKISDKDIKLIESYAESGLFDKEIAEKTGLGIWAVEKYTRLYWQKKMNKK